MEEIESTNIEGRKKCPNGGAALHIHRLFVKRGAALTFIRAHLKVCPGLRMGARFVLKEILFLIVLPVIGFAAGYGVRERISRRRRAIAREQYFESHPEERTN